MSSVIIEQFHCQYLKTGVAESNSISGVNTIIRWDDQTCFISQKQPNSFY